MSSMDPVLDTHPVALGRALLSVCAANLPVEFGLHAALYVLAEALDRSTAERQQAMNAWERALNRALCAHGAPVALRLVRDAVKPIYLVTTPSLPARRAYVQDGAAATRELVRWSAQETLDAELQTIDAAYACASGSRSANAIRTDSRWFRAHATAKAEAAARHEARVNSTRAALAAALATLPGGWEGAA